MRRGRLARVFRVVQRLGGGVVDGLMRQIVGERVTRQRTGDDSGGGTRAGQREKAAATVIEAGADGGKMSRGETEIEFEFRLST